MAKRQKPAEIIAALKAINLYEQDQDHSKDELGFIKARLPSLALHMGERDPDVLLSHIREGKEHLEALLEVHHKKKRVSKRSYESVVDSLRSIDKSFFKALREGDLDLVKSLVEQGATDPKIAEHDLYSNEEHSLLAWAAAISSGNLELIRYLAEDLKINTNRRKQPEIVSHAVRSGHGDIMHYLIDQGFRLVKTHCLMRAAEGGHLNLVKYFIENDTKIVREPVTGPLYRALDSGHLDIAGYLISKGERLHQKYWSLAVLLAAKENDLRFIKLLTNEYRAGDDSGDYFMDRCDGSKAIKSAVNHDHYEFAEYLLKFDSSLEGTYYGWALERAALTGDLKQLKRLRREYPYSKAQLNRALSSAAYNGHLETARYLLKKGADIKWIHAHTIKNLASNGDLTFIKFLHDRGFKKDGLDDDLSKAAEGGHFKLTKYLLQKGTEITPLLNKAVKGNHLNIVQYLVTQDAKRKKSVFPRTKNIYLEWAIRAEHYEMADYLVEKGAKIGSLPSHEHNDYQRYKLWKQVHSAQDLKSFKGGLFSYYMPYHIKPKTFRAVLKMIEAEGYKDIIAHTYAFNIALFFGSEERVLRYLEKWGEDGKQPLHDACHMIELPQEENFDIDDMRAWADAVMQHGPKMARFLKFSNELKRPISAAGGKGYSYINTREEIAKFGYKNGHKKPQLAALCLEFNLSNAGFDKALKQIEKYQKRYKANDNRKKEDLIPDIEIDGSAFDKEGYRFYKLADGDLRGLFLGEFTNCCQHIAGAGSDCTKHGFLSETGGFYVIADKKKDQIIGQSWAWRGKKGELCFDSLESLSGHFNGASWQKLMDAFADKVASNNEADISAVHIGKGGATPYLTCDDAKKVAVPADYKGYRDSSGGQYIVRSFR